MMMICNNETKKPLEKFHKTAIVTYTNKKSGKINKCNEEDHSRLLKEHDTLTDSRVIEAKSLGEAKQLFHGTLKVEQEYEEYSTSAWVSLDDVQFIGDPVLIFGAFDALLVILILIELSCTPCIFNYAALPSEPYQQEEETDRPLTRSCSRLLDVEIERNKHDITTFC
jgi:hypothetical protein